MPDNQPTTIRAEPGKPWPDPPAGGSWSRDPATGDLTLVAQTGEPSEEQRQAARAARRGETASDTTSIDSSAAGADQE